jgi:thioredoxin 1
MVGPVISELAAQYDGKVVIGKCNVDDEEDIAAELGVRSIPTILFYKNGEVVDKFVGAAPKAVLEEKIKALL